MCRRRRGYTLLELVITMGTGAIIMAGLTSTLYISTKTLTPDAAATAESNRSSLILSQLTGDLRLALNFTERTSKAVTFTVPDRTGDSAVETIRYSWAGAAGNPLLYQFNGGAVLTLVSNVQQFNLTSLTRTIAASSVAVPLTVAYQAPHTETAAGSAVTSLVVSTPTGLVPGNLLIAAVAVRGSVAGTLAAPAGWTAVTAPTVDSAGNVTLGVWRKIATAAESPSFNWTGAAEAYGWMMRFSGADSSSPINAAAVTAGSAASSTPTCPTVTTTVANTMIVRICALNEATITVDQANVVSGLTTITLDRSAADASSAVGGAAYVLKPAAGSASTAQFTLSPTTPTKRHVTVTLAIAPEDGL